MRVDDTRYLLPHDIAGIARGLAARGAVDLQPLRAGLQVLRAGSGPVTIAVKANAHADEPAGCVTCLRFAAWLQDDPAGRELAQQVTFHLLPTANPRGLQRNAGWLGSGEPDLLAWCREVRRDPPAEDREFGYGETPDQTMHPECAAWHRYLAGLDRLDGYVSLHSMAFSGGAWFLVMLDDLERRRGLLDSLARVGQASGLPLHDEDRGGRKGFNRIEPGFCTAPTSEAMAEFFRHSGEPGAATWLTLNSMQVAQRLHRTPVALVSELPQWWSPALSDTTPVEQLRSHLEQALGCALTGSCAELGGIDSDEAREVSLHRQSAAESLYNLAGEWGDRPAWRRDEVAATLSRRLAMAQNAAIALRAKPAPDIEQRLVSRVLELRQTCDLQPFSLSDQVAAQQGLLVALAEHLLTEGAA